MNLVLDCPSCGNRLEIGEQYFGRKVLCNVCKHPIQAPRVEAGGAPLPERGASFRADAPADDWRETPPGYRDRGPRPAWAETPPLVRRLPTGLILAAFLAALLLGGGIVGVAVWLSHVAVESSKEDVVKAQIFGTLVPAVERYRLDQGDLPDSLEDLLANPNVDLRPDQLIDPWGRLYQYSAESSHDALNGYDIWTETPSGKAIGNWKW